MSARAQAQNIVTYVTVGKKRVTAGIENLSTGGVFLRTSLAAVPGTSIALEFFDGESKKTLLIDGTVISVSEPVPGSRQQAVPGIRVKFGELNMEQHRRLGSLIESIEYARQPDQLAKIELQRAPASAPKAGPRDPSSASTSAVKRRRNRRVPTKDATAHIRLKGDVVALSVPVINVSMGGMFLQTSDSLPVGATIDVELRLAGQSMVISGEIVSEVAPRSGADRGLPSGISMRFGPMVRHTADRLCQALAVLAPGAAEGLAKEVVPGGYTVERAAPPQRAAPPPPPVAFSARSTDFDFGGGQLTPDVSELPEDLFTELERLKVEVKVRADRIAEIEKLLLE